MKKPLTITIDGPAGAGKSTVARMLAQQLGYLYVDSGAMYRAVALHSLRQNVAETEADQIAALARSTPIEFRAGESDGPQRVLLAGEDVTEAIRQPEIARLASVVSAIPGVRAALVVQQQSMGASGGVVMEGRDIGTVVLPAAEVKIFLTASPDERAARRHADLSARGNIASIEDVRAELSERDRRDATRAVSPLAAAEDAVVIESDELAPEAVIDEILSLINDRRHEA